MAELLQEVIDALPALVASYQPGATPQNANIEKLTQRCFELARNDTDRLAAQLPNLDHTATDQHSSLSGLTN